MNFSYPLGTSQADAALASGRLQRQQGAVNLRDLELQVATAVRDAARQVDTNLKRVEATRKARDRAERRLEAEQKRMTVGLSTTFQLFQAQRDLARQRQQEVNAMIDYNRSVVGFEAIQVAPVDDAQIERSRKSGTGRTRRTGNAESSSSESHDSVRRAAFAGFWSSASWHGSL